MLTISWNETPPQINQQNAARFKTLNEEDLHQIEQNQYSESTKKNTKWSIGVFNGKEIIQK
jgi:hypothetical protein